MWWPFSSTSSSSALPNKPGDSRPASCPAHRPLDGSQDSSSPVDPTTRLSTDRVVSSIPRYRPELQSAEARPQTAQLPSECPVDGLHGSEWPDQNWVYPSPHQFYHALQRKHRTPVAQDMYTVVPIHNAVNERVWSQILEWEAYYGRGAFARWPRSGKSGPMLASFRGRPDDRSPRAWLKVLSGYQAPFDRHDWEVVRPTEERMRYVVDFYPGRGADETPAPPANTDGRETRPRGMPPNLSFYLDVRPAIDNWEGLRMRLLRSWHEIFPPMSPSTPPDLPQPKESSS